MGMKVSIIVPFFNEPKIEETLKRLEDLPIPHKEIIAVDDGSDYSQMFFLLDSKKYNLLSHTHNKGKGAALRTGVEHSTGDIIIFFDADMEYDPQDIIRIAAEFEKREYLDVLYGSRFMGKVNKFLFLSFAANKVLSKLTSWILRQNITDMETGLKAFRWSVLADGRITMRQNRFGVEPEITCKVARCGYSIREFPVRYSARNYKQGKKIKPVDFFRALACLWRYGICQI